HRLGEELVFERLQEVGPARPGQARPPRWLIGLSWLAALLSFLVQDVDQLAAKFHRRADHELVADERETRAEVEAKVVRVAVDFGVLVEAVSDQRMLADFLLLELKFELRSQDEGTGAQLEIDDLAELLRLAQFQHEGAGRETLRRRLLITGLLRGHDHEALVGADLRQDLADRRAGLGVTRLLLDGVEELALLLVEQLGPVLPELRDLVEVAGTEDDVLGPKQRPRARLPRRRDVGRHLGGHAIAPARQPEGHSKAVRRAVQTAGEERRASQQIDVAAQEQREDRIVAGQAEHVLELRRLAQWFEIEPGPGQRIGRQQLAGLSHAGRVGQAGLAVEKLINASLQAFAVVA